MVCRLSWTVVTLVVALAAGAGGAAGAARLPGAPASLFECASQIRELYMGRHSYDLPSNYNRNNPPSNSTTVYISVYVNRVSGVDENKEEITLDVFLQVHWEDWRLQRVDGAPHIELPWEYRFVIWMPDLYILQLRDMKILSVFQEMTSLRIYQNSTVRVSIGATVIIKCDMDFGLYPLDVQKCSVDFSSYKYTAQDVKFVWREDKPLWYSKTAEKSFRLPKYVVSFATDKSNNLVTYGEGTHSAARLNITLSRELRSYLLESYLPSSLFVIISWGSFCVIPEIVPGRMVLLVTTLLSLVTMFDTVRNNSPSALELKCIEVWLISCTMFVFLALLEYFIVLFGIRYDKSWRRRPPAPVNPANHAQGGGGGGGLPGPGTVFTPRLATNDDAFKQQLNAQTISRESPVAEEPRAACPPGSSHYARFSDHVERAVLFCGAQKGTLDRCALMLFPLSFLLFAIIYWTTYLTEASKAQAK